MWFERWAGWRWTFERDGPVALVSCTVPKTALQWVDDLCTLRSTAAAQSQPDQILSSAHRVAITIHRSNWNSTLNIPQRGIIYTCRYVSLCLHILIWSQGYWSNQVATSSASEIIHFFFFRFTPIHAHPYKYTCTNSTPISISKRLSQRRRRPLLKA